MTNNYRLLILAPLLGYALSVNAAPHNKPGVILDYDLNADDKLSMEEFVEARRTRFTKTDTDGNGAVDEGEYVYEYEGRLQKQLEAAREAQVAQTGTRFKAINKDEDAYISRDEFIASGKRGFDYLDVNQDAVILATDADPVREKADKDDEKQPLRRRFSIGMPSSHNVAGMVALYDTDGDDKVTYDEYLAVREAQFKRTDADGNGLIDEKEYLFEFEDRLDAQIAETHESQIKQTYVRFGVLDKDEDKAMTFKEFMLSGARSFNRWDTNGDGWVTVSDPAPAPRKKPKQDKETAQADSKSVAVGITAKD